MINCFFQEVMEDDRVRKFCLGRELGSKSTWLYRLRGHQRFVPTKIAHKSSTQHGHGSIAEPTMLLYLQPLNA
jgi:hypothetical protein